MPGVIRTPRFCDITLSTQCPLRCRMCKSWQGGPRALGLSYNEVCSFVDSLASFVKEPLEINVMGGEPLLVPWCLDACSYIASKGFRPIISTNAYLITEDMARRIADSALSVLAISLESLTPSIHDFYRGVEGVHARVMRAIELVDKHCRGKVAVTLLTIIMKRNMHELIPLAEWVSKQGLFQNISYLALLETGLVTERENWHLQPAYDELWPREKAERDVTFNALIEFKKQGFPIWNPLSQLEAFKEYYDHPDTFMRTTTYALHDYILDLDEKQDVYISGERIGTMKEKSIRELWEAPETEKIRERIRTKGPGKRACVINFVCAFPPDAPVVSHGDQKKDSGMCVVDENHKKNIRTPRFCVIELTHACPMRCAMCYNWNKPERSSHLSVEDLKRFISQLAAFVKRPFEINLAGGEPLLVPYLVELIHHIRAHDMTVSLTTTGYTLTEPILRSLSSSGLTYMPFSLDSLDAEIHDYLRGRPGAHAQVLRSLTLLQQNRGCLRNLTIQTILMKPTFPGIIPLLRWAHEGNIAVSLMALMRPNGIPVDAAWFEKDEYRWLWPDTSSEVDRTLDEIIALKDQGYRIDNAREQLEAFKEYFRNPRQFIRKGTCSLGDGIINVNPEGDMYICWEKGALGNIRTHHAERVWYSQQACTARTHIQACTRNCSEMVNCYFEPEESVRV